MSPFTGPSSWTSGRSMTSCSASRSSPMRLREAVPRERMSTSSAMALMGQTQAVK